MNVINDSKFREIKSLAEKQGFSVTKTKGGHWKFIPPNKSKPIVIVAGTSSDIRAMDISIRRLKSSGLIVDILR